MRTRQELTRWPALLLACCLLTIAVTSQAAKPVKPPPPSTPAYAMMVLGGLRGAEGGISTSAADVNNAGLVVGRTSIPGQPYAENSQPFLLKPRDANGDGIPDTWFVDELNNATGALGPDGQNDLIIGLGNLPGASEGQAIAINDLGMIVGISHVYDPMSNRTRSQAFILMPEHETWYEDADGDGYNDLMVSLGSLHGNGESSEPTDINSRGQIVGWCSAPDANGVYQGSGFLLTPVEVAGVRQWFQDDGHGGNAWMVDLGDFVPSGINDSGQVVGHSGGQVGGGIAVLRQPDGTLIDLRAGGTQSDAKAINNRGQVGLLIHLTSDDWQDWRAGLVTPLDWNNDGFLEWYRDANGDGLNGLIVDLGTVDRLNNSNLARHGLNEAGSVVGVSWTYHRDFPLATPRTRAPFLWEKGVFRG